MKTKKYRIKAFLGLIGVFFILLGTAGPGFCGWADKLEEWSRRFHEFEETTMDSAGWWVAREIGGRIAPHFFWEGPLSTFDPIGKAFVPIEDRIPGLDITGSIEFDMRKPLHGNLMEDNMPRNFIINPLTGRRVPCPPSRPRCGGKGGRPIPGPRLFEDAEPEFIEASWLTELEFDYNPVPWFKLDTILQYRYDAAYDWDDEFRELYKGNRKRLQLQGYRTDELILRELFLSIARGPVEVTLGKQQIAWGKMFTRVMDFINPDFLGTGISESGRHPLWIARFMYWWKDWHFEGVFTPDWERNILLDSSRVKPPTRVQGALPGTPTLPEIRVGGPDDVRYDKPGDGFSEPQFGFRIGFEKGKWETDLAYWYGWTHHSLMGGGRLSSPTFRRVLGLGRDARGRLLPVVLTERQEVRLHFISLSVVRPFYKVYRDWVLRFENVLIKNTYNSVTRDLQLVGTGRYSKLDPSGNKKKDWLVSAFEISTSVFRDFGVSFSSIITAILPYDSTLISPARGDKIHNIDHRIRFGIRKPFYEGRMSVGFDWDHTTSQGDGRYTWSYTYEPSEYLEFSLGGRSWYGKWNTPDGEGASTDEVEFQITYSF